MSETKVFTPPRSQPNEERYRRRERGDQARRWGLMLLLVGVIWLVFQLSNQSNWFGFGFVEGTVSIPPQTLEGNALQVVGVNDYIELVHHNGPGIEVQSTLHGFGWNINAARDDARKLDIQITQNNDTVRIEVERPPSALLFGRSPYAELRIAVPANVQLDIEAVNGELTVQDIRANGELRTTNGDIEVANTQGDLVFRTINGEIYLSRHRGSLFLDTINGDIELVDGQARDVRVESVNGDIELQGVAGQLDIQTISGDISVNDVRNAELQVVSTNGDIAFRGRLASNATHSIETISGDVDMELPRSSNLNLDITTLNGDLDTTFDLRDATRERRTLSGTIGAGGNTLRINTTNGDVQIDADS
ncbi:MAG: DUF4097 domain-containing protein [Chloroflexales bacterium]|nr:DUF4097 domain-containing protein [Chloroflexales bacterium]